jgi:hypothetical protein
MTSFAARSELLCGSRDVVSVFTGSASIGPRREFRYLLLIQAEQPLYLLGILSMSAEAVAM